MLAGAGIRIGFTREDSPTKNWKYKQADDMYTFEYIYKFIYLLETTFKFTLIAGLHKAVLSQENKNKKQQTF